MGWGTRRKHATQGPDARTGIVRGRLDLAWRVVSDGGLLVAVEWVGPGWETLAGHDSIRHPLPISLPEEHNDEPVDRTLCSQVTRVAT
jgi:hypothetical protein